MSEGRRDVSVMVPATVPWNAGIVRHLHEHLPYLVPAGASIAIAERRVTVGTDQLPAADLLALVEDLVRACAAGGADKVLHEWAAALGASTHDPMPDLLGRGVVRRVGPGRCAYGGDVLVVVEALDALVRRTSEAWGAEVRQFPTVLATDQLIRAGYLRAFGHHALLVAPVALSHDAVARVSAATSAGAIQPDLAAPTLALSPTVCHHGFDALAGTTMDRDYALTAVNPCHRHELLPSEGLDRLHVFRMRESVHFGTPEHVEAMLDRWVDWWVSQLQAWGCGGRVVSAGDPFFGAPTQGQRSFQRLFRLKREVTVPLDHTGDWLAVASCNFHRETLTRAFAISGPSAPWMSGCMGVGLERMTYALMARWGTRVEGWPESVRDSLGIPPAPADRAHP